MRAIILAFATAFLRWTAAQICPEDFAFYRGICFQFPGTNSTFISAFNQCYKRNSGVQTDLITVNNIKSLSVKMGLAFIRINAFKDNTNNWKQATGPNAQFENVDFSGFEFQISSGNPGDTLLFINYPGYEKYLYIVSANMANYNSYIFQPVCQAIPNYPTVDDTWNLVSNQPNLIINEDLQGTYSEILKKMSDKIDDFASPKGDPFKQLRGINQMANIAIVGAGPAGLDMAFRLKYLGYKNIKVLEKTNRVGGKVEFMQLRGTKQQVSARFWTNDFKETLEPLLEYFGFQDSIGTIEEPLFWPRNDPSESPINQSKFMTDWIMTYLGIRNVNEALTKIVEDVAKYINLHRKLFGKYKHQIMRRPSNEILKALDGSMKAFLVRHDLSGIFPIVSTLIQSFGYSTVDQLPMLYGFLYITPRHLLDYLMKSRVKFLKFKTLQDLFQAMAGELDIEFNFQVDQIILKDPTKPFSGGHKVFDQNGRLREFDHIFWSGLPSQLPRVLAASELKAKLGRILGRNSHHSASVSIVEMKGVGKIASWQVFAAQAFAEKLDNDVMEDFDSYAASMEIPPRNYVSGFQYNDGTSSLDRKVFTAFQYCLCMPSLQETHEKLIKHYEAFAATEIEILRTFSFDHFPKWSVEQTSDGYHWELYDLQGENDIWIIGGGIVFDSLTHVIGYNQLLLEQMQN